MPQALGIMGTRTRAAGMIYSPWDPWQTCQLYTLYDTFRFPSQEYMLTPSHPNALFSPHLPAFATPTHSAFYSSAVTQVDFSFLVCVGERFKVCLYVVTLPALLFCG